MNEEERELRSCNEDEVHRRERVLLSGVQGKERSGDGGKGDASAVSMHVKALKFCTLDA